MRRAGSAAAGTHAHFDGADRHRRASLDRRGEVRRLVCRLLGHRKAWRAWGGYYCERCHSVWYER